MFRKCILLIPVTLFVLGFARPVTYTAAQLESIQNNTIQLLLVYSSPNGKQDPQVKKMDMMLHHFTANIKIIADQDMTIQDTKQADYIVYYGETKKELSKQTAGFIADFRGTVIVIGENADQIPEFSNFFTGKKVKINGIGTNSSSTEAKPLNKVYTFNQIKTRSDSHTLLYGFKGDKAYPLLTSMNNKYLLPIGEFEDALMDHLIEAMHEILPNQHSNEHTAYLRLEDIHPLTDPDKLLAIGKYLNNRDIPYVLVVIPVYITPGTGKRVYLSESPRLVKVLRYLQKTGGSIIAHGYTHQYRDRETGEGFEFWDAENDQFIYAAPTDESIDEVKPPSAFSSGVAYQSYLKPFLKRENNYIQKRLLHSISELTDNGLYPLAFEAPHYTMSQQGYGITADYFTAFFGQAQLSDKTYKVMYAPPVLTTASFLHGMTLYPETIGFVDPALDQPFLQINNKLQKDLVVRDSMIGAFYHPYLGLDYLPDLLKVYEQAPNLTWLDLKHTNQHTQTSKIQIVSKTNSSIHVTGHTSWVNKLLRHTTFTLFEKVLWVIAILVFIFISIFFIITIYLRTQIKKRLFKERKYNG